MAVRRQSHGAGVLALLAGGALLAAAPTPVRSVETLRSLASRAVEQQDPLAGVLALVTLAAWSLVAYLTLVVLLTWATRLPRAGVVCAGLLRRVAPATLRSAVAVTLGVTVVVGSVSGASAATGSGTAASIRSLGSAGATGADPSAIGDLDWPVPAAPAASSAPAATPSTTPASTPSSTPAAAPSIAAGTAAAAAPGPSSGTSRTPPAPAPAVQVVVQAGDTLWGLAAQTLPSDASSAAVAAAWPRWWEANRDVIGENPDRLWPGQVLHAPS